MGKKFVIIILFYSMVFQLSIGKVQNGNYLVEIFDSQQYMKGQFAKNLNGDMIIEFSSEGHRLFYGLRENGKGFFDGNYIKEIYLDNQKRYESKNLFITTNSSDDNTQYLFSFGSNITVVELYDIEKDISQSGNYVTDITSNVLGNSIYLEIM